MRTAAIVFATVMLAATRPTVAQEWPATPAHLRLVEGEGLVQISGETVWTPATSNLPLGPGDRAWVTSQGRMEIQMPGQTIVRLGDATRLHLGALPAGDARSIRIALERGTAAVHLGRSEPQTSIRLDLPEAAAHATGPSTFRASVLPDGSAQVVVHSGEVIVETSAERVRVRDRQTVRLTPDRLPRLYGLDPPDDFDRWNELRDRQLAATPSGPALPADLVPYAPSFVDYGRWVSIPEHGHVWAPVVDPAWTPFRSGRWIWWRGEYVWVADEPWGWAPHHYGRWLFYPPIGWVWVPPVTTAVVWSPGAVGWIVGPEFVAWCPLAPGEIVSITNVHVIPVHVTKVFINAKVKNGTVIVHRDTFHTRRRRPASFVAPKDVFADGGRVTPELPRDLRPARAPIARASLRPVMAPVPSSSPLQHAAREAGQPSLTRPPGSRWPLTPSETRTVPDKGGRPWPAVRGAPQPHGTRVVQPDGAGTGTPVPARSGLSTSGGRWQPSAGDSVRVKALPGTRSVQVPSRPTSQTGDGASALGTLLSPRPGLMAVPGLGRTR